MEIKELIKDEVIEASKTIKKMYDDYFRMNLKENANKHFKEWLFFYADYILFKCHLPPEHLKIVMSEIIQEYRKI